MQRSSRHQQQPVQTCEPENGLFGERNGADNFLAAELACISASERPCVQVLEATECVCVAQKFKRRRLEHKTKASEHCGQPDIRLD